MLMELMLRTLVRITIRRLLSGHLIRTTSKLAQVPTLHILHMCLFMGSKQWGFDNQNDSTNNIESYSITIPLSTSQVFSYATGSSGNDLTNILKISGNTMIVRTFRSLQTDENNFVKRPFHYIIVCKQLSSLSYTGFHRQVHTKSMLLLHWRIDPRRSA